jgi:two-component system, OmpR family, sensor kinase
VNLYRPLRDVRTRLLLIVVVALTLALGAATFGFNLLLAHSTSSDADAFLRARAAAELGLISVVHGKIRVAETQDDALGSSSVWIFHGRTPVESPPERGETTAAAQALAGGPTRLLDVRDTDTRLYAVPIVADGRRMGTLVTGLSLAPYEQTRSRALAGSITLFVVLLAIVGSAVWWLLRSALLPVAQMTKQAAAWSEHDLDRRFGLGEPHDELTRLGATLDGLLDRLAASLRHERRFSAELSHELRTPLAKMMAEAEVALRRDRTTAEYRESLGVVVENAQQIARIVDSLVAAAQHSAQPKGVANAQEVAEAIVAACSDEATSRGVDLALDKPLGRVRIGVDQDLAERILHPVVENACRYGRSAVRVAVAREGSTVVFSVDDDGPGVEDAEQEVIFEPAVRGSAGRSAASGAGLGLALARRLARAASGDVEARPGGRGQFVVRLPAA